MHWEKSYLKILFLYDGTLSCHDCHQQQFAFSDAQQFSIGINGTNGNRNASSLTNVGWNNRLNWDGSASLEEQAFEPINNPLK